jgi:hypothetical protein
LDESQQARIKSEKQLLELKSTNERLQRKNDSVGANGDENSAELKECQGELEETNV